MDVVISSLAQAQDGVMKREQLVARGATPAAIKHRLRVQRLFQIHRGVYALQPTVFGRGRYRAGVYACGSGAALGCRAAADHLGLRLRSVAPLEVVVPRGNGCRPKGIRVHESRSLLPEDVTIVDGIPCTTWARTIVDCAALLPERELDRMLERSMILRVFDLNMMRRTLERAIGRKGTTTIHSRLEKFLEPLPTRKEFERAFLDLTRSLGIADPIVNGTIGDHEVDFHWPEEKVIVETDGRETHDTPYGWERDRERDLTLDLDGWHVIRVTWRMLKERPQRVAALLLARLSERSQDSVPARAG